MDDEWVILPPDLRLEYPVDCTNKKYGVTSSTKSPAVPNIVIDANHFVCPASPPKDMQVSSDYDSLVGDVAKMPLEVILLSPAIASKVVTDEDLASRVSFKKIREIESVDTTKSSGARVLLRSASPPPAVPIDWSSFGSEIADNRGDKARSPRFSKTENVIVEHQVAWEEINNSGLNFWKWSLTGVGAICSFGVVAVATVCILMLGSHRNSNQRPQKQNLRVQIYADEKRLKNAVHHAAKLNDAASLARGIPFSRTPITYGYFDGI